MVLPTALVRRKSTDASERAHFIFEEELSNSRRLQPPAHGSYDHQHPRKTPHLKVVQSIEFSRRIRSSALLLYMLASSQSVGSWDLEST